MIDPSEVDRVPDEEWDEFRDRAVKDELFYNGPGDLLDTPEGREKFCRLNVYIWVFNNQGQGLVIKKRSKADPALMVNTEYDAAGIEMSKSYEPA